MNEKSCFFELRGIGASIQIRVLDFEHPDAELREDAEWLRCEVQVTLEGVKADFEASFMVSDFESLEQELAAVLASPPGAAAFKPYEGGLSFEAVLSARGEGTLGGTASRKSGQRVSLSFMFLTDQTYLQQGHKSLQQLLSSLGSQAQANGKLRNGGCGGA